MSLSAAAPWIVHLRPGSAGALMAKKKAAKPETKSDFLRRVLSRNPDLDYGQVNRRWAKSGHVGEISNALYYQVRAKLGIKTVWQWVRVSEPETPGGATGQVYQFKVTLLGSNPPIWRRIQVENCTLEKLHEYLQIVMGWTNSHMHHFRVEDRLYGDPALLEMTFGELKYADSTRTKLSDILPEHGRRFAFLYEYDFGDSWEHEILFEKAVVPEPKAKYPRCLEGERACPPEDVGGVWGYADFLEAMADPKHENHRDMKEWIGGKFDPDKFSVVAVNRELRRYP